MSPNSQYLQHTLVSPAITPAKREKGGRDKAFAFSGNEHAKVQSLTTLKNLYTYVDIIDA